MNSRYYDPGVGRFLNADGYASTGQGLVGFNMFAYCGNNPVNYIDRDGNFAAALDWWSKTMWWLCLVDATIPIGDAIYGAGILVLGIGVLAVADEVETPRVILDEEVKDEQEKPDVKYPGDDPTKAPEGYEWRGKGEQGSGQGNYYNPKTGESWHPDLEHPDPIGPHWDYKDPSGTWWRVGPKGDITLK